MSVAGSIPSCQSVLFSAATLPITTSIQQPNTVNGTPTEQNLKISVDPYTSYLNNVESQQLEIDKLKQRIKILAEQDVKNKQEIKKWSNKLAVSQQNEKNLRAKYDELSNDFKSLEIKHDGLENEYFALDQKYEELLKAKNNESKQAESWDCDNVAKWIMNLDGGKYKKYENFLTKNINIENIDGQCLEHLDKGDLHRLGVTDFKDKVDLLQKIKHLVCRKEQ